MWLNWNGDSGKQTYFPNIGLNDSNFYWNNNFEQFAWNYNQFATPNTKLIACKLNVILSLLLCKQPYSITASVQIDSWCEITVFLFVFKTKTKQKNSFHSIALKWNAVIMNDQNKHS